MHSVLEEGGHADSAKYGCAKGMKWADLENLSTTVSVTTSSTRTHGAPREPAEMCSLSVMRARLDAAAVWSEAVMSKVGPDTMSAASTSMSCGRGHPPWGCCYSACTLPKIEDKQFAHLVVLRSHGESSPVQLEAVVVHLDNERPLP